MLKDRASQALAIRRRRRARMLDGGRSGKAEGDDAAATQEVAAPQGCHPTSELYERAADKAPAPPPSRDTMYDRARAPRR